MKTTISIFLSTFLVCMALHNPLSAGQIVILPKDSSQVVSSIKQFLNWYKQNYSHISTFRLTYEDPSGFYQVDQGACNAYLKYLSESGYFSENYIQLWSDYFENRIEYFKINPQNEGPPDGFEFDLVLITQEPTLVMDAVEQLNYIVDMDNHKTAIVLITGEFEYEIEMSKVNGKWLIDYISTMNFD